jgi:hypothetical protein
MRYGVVVMQGARRVEVVAVRGTMPAATRSRRRSADPQAWLLGVMRGAGESSVFCPYVVLALATVAGERIEQ